jgi:diguanylate cyclase (GGDEF)-like protein
MSRISMRVRLIVLLTMILTLGFAGVSLVSYRVSRESLRAGIIGDALPAISDNIYSDIQRDIARPVHVSSLMANDAFVKDWVLGGEKDVAQIQRYLAGIRNRYGFVSTFLVSDRTRRYYHFRGIHKTVSPDDAHDVWYFDFAASGKEWDLDVDTDEAAANAPTVFINHRLDDYDGNFLGVTGVGLSLSNLSAMLADYEARYGREVCLVDDAGVVQVAPEAAKTGRANLYTEPGIGSHAGALLTSADLTLVEYDTPKGHIIASSRRIPELAWHLVVRQNETAALSTIRAHLVRSLGAGALITLLALLITAWVVNAYQQRLEVLANMDELTGVPNRRRLLQRLEEEWARARRFGHPLAVILVDVDHFKSVNDAHGHAVGDRVLAEVARTARGCLREVDVLGRTGGEEFVAVLPETGSEGGRRVAERIRSTVGAADAPGAGVAIVGVTVSLGVASLDPETASPADLLRLADMALYRAKAAGRNRVEVAGALGAHSAPAAGTAADDDGAPLEAPVADV